MTQPATLKDAYRFFLPLMFMAELMMISHSVIHAFLARMDDPKPILAAYSIAFYFHTTVGSPVWTIMFVSISFIRDKEMVRRLFIFYLVVGFVVAWLWMLAGLTPWGSLFFQRAFGASPAVAAQAQQAIVVLMFIVFPVIIRSLGYALFMINRRTMMITYGTMVRLTSLVGLLAILPTFMEGAAIGAAALVGCITTEAIYVSIFARPYYNALPALRGSPSSYWDIWCFSWPIMMVHAAESGVGFTINLFLGRLARPELALASFGVMDGIMRLLLSPLRSLTQTGQTLTQSSADFRVMLRFLAQLITLFGLAMLLFFLAPVRRVVLESVMGLTPEISSYVAPALLLASLLAVTMGCSAMFRGLVIAARRTGAIATSAVARLAAVIAVGGIAMMVSDANGAVVGMIALIAAFGAEALVLGWRMIYLSHSAQGLFQESVDSEPVAPQKSTGGGD